MTHHHYYILDSYNINWLSKVVNKTQRGWLSLRVYVVLQPAYLLQETGDPLRWVSKTMAIVESCSLIQFAKAHGRMKIAPFVNKETGEHFKSCVFIDPKDENNKTLCSFSSNLGELSPAEIKAQAADLQVVTLDSGTHKLCAKGDSAWEDVELDL